MARQTRSSARTKSGASTSTTPSSVVSPVFSTKTSVQSTTPDTSDVDTNTPDKSKARATRSVTVGVKRKRASSPEPSEVATEPVTPQRRKRQGPQAYVELPLMASRSRALKVRTYAPNTMFTSLNQIQGKSRATSTAVSEEEVLDSQDDELEYDEQASLYNDSDDSGSEFQISDDDELVEDSQDDDDITTDTKLRSFAEALTEEGIDADEIMMDVVVQESLELARSAQLGDSAGAGGSNSQPARTAAAALRAAAAERRLARLQDGASDVIDVDVYDSDSEQAPMYISSDMSSEDEPLNIKGKKKAKKEVKTKAKGKAKAKGNTKSAGNKTTWAEKRREQRRLDTERKAEEKALRKKLGRKLTLV